MTVLNESSPKIDVPSSIPLFPHQQATLAEMVKCEKRRGTYVLDDAPGTGKSFSILALLLREKLKARSTVAKEKTLIVIPLSIHQQWLQYIETFSAELTVYSLMFLGDINKLHFDTSVLFDYDILLTTPSFYGILADTITSLGSKFRRVVIDEIDSMSFYIDKPITADTVWLVSASAKATQDCFYQEHARRHSIRCDPGFIKESIDLPAPKAFVHPCSDPYVDILHEITFEQDKKPLHALNFLPYKFDYAGNSPVSSAKMLIARAFQDYCIGLRTTKELLENLRKGLRNNTMLKAVYDVHAKQKLIYEMKIDELLEKLGTKDAIFCPLCCDNRPHIDLDCCKVKICTKCANGWLNDGCPFCTDPVDPEIIKTIPDPAVKEEDAQPKSNDVHSVTKIDRLQAILSEEMKRSGARILIFSEYPETFVPVRQLLTRMKIKYAELEGNQLLLDKNMTNYKVGRRPVLLVDAKNYGAGMNLEFTTAVVIMHRTSREEQIVGRANRCGRDPSLVLHVHTIVYTNE